MITQDLKIECPECGCKAVYSEYDSDYEYNSSNICSPDNDILSVEPLWRYCMRCGVMFDPVQAAFAV